jgi:hypothetical protein
MNKPYLSPALARVVTAFLDGILPDAPDFDVSAAKQRVPDLINASFDPERFDSPMLRQSLPWIVRLLQWSPIIFFWISWFPLPLTWMSRRRRTRFLARLEHSRIYGARGLLLVGKVSLGMFLFDQRETWGPIGYDGRGLLPLDQPADGGAA